MLLKKVKEGRGGGSFQTMKYRFNLYMEKIRRRMASKKENHILHLVLQYRLFKTLCLIQSWGKTSKGGGKMIGTECIFSEYSLKARITLMLLIWLERLRFLVSSQHSSVSTTGRTVLAITRLQTVWEEVLHALRSTRLSVCRTCGRASDPKGCASS